MTALLLSSALAATLAAADAGMPHDRTAGAQRSDAPALGFSLGHVGIFDDIGEPLIASAEYRFSDVTDWQLVPAAGISAAENGAYFVYADLHYEVRLGEHWILSPSFGVGRFGGSDEIDLGHLVEFRSGLEIRWQFDNGYSLGLALHHFSNGGISERNPGIEELALTLHVPLGN
ncbi:MAG TPA: acyloxyacyl hydrolase [Gammaproteobacteria bacterium]